MAHKLNNPIIPGFYPDPSICRVGDDYYLACSSFELCPAIPVFHSKDLAHWEQIGYALTPENGLHVEKNTGNGGVMAPTIRYHDGLFCLTVLGKADGGDINPEKVGCMVGTMLGMFATGNGVSSDNQAEFDWCEMR